MSLQVRGLKQKLRMEALRDYIFDFNISSFYLETELPNFSRRFQEWRDHRRQTIRTIQDLQKEIDTLCLRCNVAKGVGAAVGLVGMGSQILGAILTMQGHKSAAQFVTGGTICNATSFAVGVSSTLLELGMSQNILNEIERVLKRDEELTEQLMNWTRHSKVVDSISQQLFQCSVLSSTFIDVLKVCAECINLLETGEGKIKHEMKQLAFIPSKMQVYDDLTIEVFQKVKYFIKNFLEDKEIRSSVKKIFRIFQKKTAVFEFAKFGMIMSGEVNILSTSILTSCMSFAGLACPGSRAATIATRCALDTIKIATDVVTIILSVKNIKDGKSQYSEALDKIIQALSSELMEANKEYERRIPVLRSIG